MLYESLMSRAQAHQECVKRAGSLVCLRSLRELVTPYESEAPFVLFQEVGQVAASFVRRVRLLLGSLAGF
jgi:hypothetical protein